MYKKQIIMIAVMAVLTVLLGVAAVQAAPSAQGYYGYPVFGDLESTWGYYGYGYSSGSCSACTYACDRAEFIKDVTIPDGAYIAPGASFVKTWRIRNIGTTTWTTAYRLVFTSGNSMSAYNSVALPYSVSPGKWVDISISMRAPNAGGTFQGNWMLQGPGGNLFGVGCNGQVPVWAKINTARNICSCIPAYNCNCGTPVYGGSNWPVQSYQKYPSPYPTPVARNPFCNNKIRSITDITFKDGTEIEPNTEFRKTWKMKNGGTCVWNEGYSLIFSGGDGIGVSGAVKMPKNVYPGQYVELSIDLKSPTIPGKYRGYFLLQDNLGYSFGYGSYANSPFWAEIQVIDSAVPASEPVAVLQEVVSSQEVISAPVAVPAPAVASAPAAPSAPAVNASAVLIPSSNSTVVPAVTSTQAAAPTITVTPSVNILNVTHIENDEALYSDDPSADAAYTDVLEPGEGVVKSIKYNECGEQHIEITFAEPNIYNIKWFVANSGTSVWNPDTYRVINSGLSDNLVMIGSDITVPITNPGEEAMVSMAVKAVDIASTADLWLKYHLTDGKESFCEVYFPLN